MNKVGMRVIAVVVTHNRPEELRQVVLALLNQTRKPERIVVLDNASPTPAATVLADLPAIEVVRSAINSGGAGGFALGITEALKRNADWFWLMDDDAVPRADALSALLDVLPDLSESTGALCTAVYEYGALALMHRRYFGKLLGTERVIPRQSYEQKAVEIDTGSFVGFLVAAKAVQQIGLPDTEFFLAYDDTDYSLRLKRAGWRIWLVPASVIDHLRTAASRLRSSQFGAKHYYNIRNHIIVVMRYCRFPKLAGFIATVFGFGLWLFCSRLRQADSYSIFRRAVADGWRQRLGLFTGKV